jgi:hypothetical protein
MENASTERNDQGSSFWYGASSNAVSVNANDSEPIDSNAAEAQKVHLNAVSNSVPLLKRSLRVGAYGSKFKLLAMFDGEPTDSFVRLSCLPDVVTANYNASRQPCNEPGRFVQENLFNRGRHGYSSRTVRSSSEIGPENTRSFPRISTSKK